VDRNVRRRPASRSPELMWQNSQNLIASFLAHRFVEHTIQVFPM